MLASDQPQLIMLVPIHASPRKGPKYPSSPRATSAGRPGFKSGLADANSIDGPLLPVFVPMLVALKRCSLYRQPHEFTNDFLKLLLLLPVVHHHERVDCLFPPLHAVMVVQS